MSYWLHGSAVEVTHVGWRPAVTSGTGKHLDGLHTIRDADYFDTV